MCNKIERLVQVLITNALIIKKKKKKTTTTIQGLSAPTTTGEKRVTDATGEQQLTHYIFQRKKLNMHSTTIRIFLSVFLF